MATQQHVDLLLKRDIVAWNKWREDNPKVEPDLQEADLMGASLRGMNLMGVNLEKAFLSAAYLEGADLREARLKEAYLGGIHLEGANLSGANLEGAFLSEANLAGTNLCQARMRGADMSKVHLEGADMSQSSLIEVNLSKAHLEGANLKEAHLEGANLRDACLEGTCVSPDELNRIQQWKQNFPAVLPSADLRGAFFDSATDLTGITLGNEKHGFTPLADIRWNSVNIAVIEWSSVKTLGDENEARQWKQRGYDKAKRLEKYRQAVRAHRQIATILQDQGMNEQADRFAYRMQRLQRKVLWLQVFQQFIGAWGKVGNSWLWRQLGKIGQRLHKFGEWLCKLGAFLLSLFLDVLAGYGYKPGRALFWYLVVIVGFAIAYSVLGYLQLFPDALIFSVASFHGRGFFPIDNKASLHDLLTLHNSVEILAASEAVVGLIIEISLVATFTKRFFGR